ncbi:hypothetical protein OE88DRAFT_1651044 [Heliocybe sulcata]|uniref:SEC7 domain-containing protein n=1 Tax=Heliocybe sulcata TaxID=5364 RepID=A0A5C3NIZ4_9AGAM|nr:hypothetical protein OE88DRAFT_1651044 [Heliocybe sulcata]
MVGVFGLGNKSSSSGPSNSSPIAPPPYSESEPDPSVLLAETTTTTTHVVTTTTHTTTHFFSLPLWRRRAAPSSSTASARQSLVEPNVDENGIIIHGATSHTVMVEKALPPIPVDLGLGTPPLVATPETEEYSMATRPSGELFPRSQSTVSILSSPQYRSRQPSRPSTASSASQALAQASLGLGLPHVMPHAAASSSSEVNSVIFNPSDLEEDAGSASSPLRRAKSFRVDHPTGQAEDVANGGRRRTRGVSLGPYNLFGSGSDSKGKGKDNAVQDESPSPPTSRPLSRKTSIFSRKRINSEKSMPPLPTRSTDALGMLDPSLPYMPPVSPFHVDVLGDTSQRGASPEVRSSTLRPPVLVRRHSDRSGHIPSPPSSPPYVAVEHHQSPTSVGLSARGDHQTKRKTRRPSTADSGSRARSRSMFLDSTSLYTSTLSPPPMPPTPRPLTAGERSSPNPNSVLPVPRPVPRSKTTNHALLHRLSMNFFSSSPNPNSSSILLSDTLSASPTSSPVSSPRVSLSRPPVQVPKPRTEEESPEVYLDRLLEAVSKAEVASVLASSADSFHARALEAYIARFDFSSDPLDVALRRLLMDVGLPKETQQIDRVIEAFANRYKVFNANLFTSNDHPYILAFSLIMLHTDAFNKSNKKKMSKPDYIKNTRLPGVLPEVLDCFYDNIVFAPFIFIEDPLDINGQRGVLTEGSPSHIGTVSAITSSPAAGSSTNLLGRGTKIDPYYLITRNLLNPLRVAVDSLVPLDNPYSYEGTAGSWDDEDLRYAFAKASVIEVNTFDNRRMSQQPFFSLSANGLSSPMMGSVGALPDLAVRDMMTIKVTKVGVLYRKDDTVEGGKKALSRKWREWSVVLTGSQLLLFRDTQWALNLLEQMQTSDGHVLFPPDAILRPDELISVKDSVAVFDRSYTKHQHTLRFVMSDGRQTLLRTSNDRELDEWISRINYASAFKTAGVRMRNMGMSGREVELTGVAAATSHLKDMQHVGLPSPRIRTWSDLSSDQTEDIFPVPDVLADAPSLSARRSAGHVRASGSFEDPRAASELQNSQQFKATFDEIKAELAAGRLTLSEEPSSVNGRARADSSASSLRSPLSDESHGSGFLSRTEVIRSKVKDLDAKISATQTQLDADMRFVRNIAILTPFQKATRDRLQTAVQNMSKRVMQVRLDMAKLLCHRQVLSNDLIAEERDWYRNKKMALRAAKEVLDSSLESPVPRMTLSNHGDVQDGTAPLPHSRSQPLSAGTPRPESSIRDSFYSAMDYGMDSSSYSASLDDPAIRSTFLNTPQSTGSPSASPLMDGGGTSSVGSLSVHGHDQVNDVHGSLNPGRSSDVIASSVEGEDSQTHERFYTAPEMAEEAEDWNKTRAAKRVSLVKLPSDLRISMLFGKPKTGPAEQNASIPETSVASSPTRSRSNTFDRSGLAYAMFDI